MNATNRPPRSDEIRRLLKLLSRPGQVGEMRSPKGGDHKTAGDTPATTDTRKD